MQRPDPTIVTDSKNERVDHRQGYPVQLDIHDATTALHPSGIRQFDRRQVLDIALRRTATETARFRRRSFDTATPSRKVSRRRAAQAHQIEAFELFNSSHLEFRLRESALWERICRDAVRRPRTLGT